jgi:hypothetical protein
MKKLIYILIALILLSPTISSASNNPQIDLQIQELTTKVLKLQIELLLKQVEELQNKLFQLKIDNMNKQIKPQEIISSPIEPPKEIPQSCQITASIVDENTFVFAWTLLGMDEDAEGKVYTMIGQDKGTAIWNYKGNVLKKGQIYGFNLTESVLKARFGNATCFMFFPSLEKGEVSIPGPFGPYKNMNL